MAGYTAALLHVLCGAASLPDSALHKVNGIYPTHSSHLSLNHPGFRCPQLQMYNGRGHSRGWNPAYQGRSSRSGRGSTPSSNPYQAEKIGSQRAQSPPLGSLKMIINERELEMLSKIEGDAPYITDCEALASYSWLNKNEHAILVPGKYFSYAWFSNRINCRKTVNETLIIA